MTRDETLAERLTRADQHWERGELVDARKDYLHALELAPACWQAAFQVAWIDAAFGPPEQDPLPALRRPGLPRDAAVRLDELGELIERLRSGEATALPGTVADWDARTLQRSPHADDRRFWERSAERAAEVGQYGLAYWCHQEAAELAPNLYADPPGKMRRAFMDASEHLAFLRAVRLLA